MAKSHSQTSKEWREQDPERSRLSKNISRQKSMEKYPLYGVAYAARQRAKERGLEFNLDWKTMEIPSLCPILQIPLIKGVGHVTGSSPSLDRIDPTKGYTNDNVRVISHRANALKSNMPIEVFERVVKYMKGEI